MKFKSLQERRENLNEFSKKWLNESSIDVLKTKEWLDEMEIEDYIINDDGTVDVDDSVWLDFKGLTEIPVQFNKVSGSFYCNGNNLTSLRGCPRVVGGRGFNCSTNQLTSLEGCPTKVGGSFWCSNNNLSSLKGAPTRVGGNFECNNNNLTSLEGAPTEVGGDLYIEDNPIELTTPLLRKIRQYSNIGGNIFKGSTKDKEQKRLIASNKVRALHLKKKIQQLQQELAQLEEG